MIAMRVMQVPIHQIIHVVTVRHGLMAAAGAVNMARLVSGALVLRRTCVGVLLRNLDHVLIDMIAVRMMQMAIVQIVDMVAVANRRVTAFRPMLVRVVGMMGMRTSGHCWPPASRQNALLSRRSAALLSSTPKSLTRFEMNRYKLTFTMAPAFICAFTPTAIEAGEAPMYCKA